MGGWGEDPMSLFCLLIVLPFLLAGYSCRLRYRERYDTAVVHLPVYTLVYDDDQQQCLHTTCASRLYQVSTSTAM